MIKIIHPVAGGLAILMIATFWLSTALSELFASQAIVTTVKTAIAWGFLVLVPALAAAGGLGFALAKGRRAQLVGGKIKRMYDERGRWWYSTIIPSHTRQAGSRN
jgi:hypothetical protein